MAKKIWTFLKEKNLVGAVLFVIGFSLILTGNEIAGAWGLLFVIGAVLFYVYKLFTKLPSLKKNRKNEFTQMVFLTLNEDTQELSGLKTSLDSPSLNSTENGIYIPDITFTFGNKQDIGYIDIDEKTLTFYGSNSVRELKLKDVLDMRAYKDGIGIFMKKTNSEYIFQWSRKVKMKVGDKVSTLNGLYIASYLHYFCKEIING